MSRHAASSAPRTVSARAASGPPALAAERLETLVRTRPLDEHEALHVLVRTLDLDVDDTVAVRSVLALAEQGELAPSVRALIRSTLDRWTDDDVRKAVLHALDG